MRYNCYEHDPCGLLKAGWLKYSFIHGKREPPLQTAPAKTDFIFRSGSVLSETAPQQERMEVKEIL